MYAGQMVEQQAVDGLFDRPRHPYTAALLDALPERNAGRRRLPTISGVVPGQFDRPGGCLFNPRCTLATDHCRTDAPAAAVDDRGLVRCHTPLHGAGGAP
jgi:dipeptide transport system ATP-binding protein